MDCILRRSGAIAKKHRQEAFHGLFLRTEAQVNGGERDFTVIVIYVRYTDIANSTAGGYAFGDWRLVQCNAGNVEVSRRSVFIYGHAGASAMRLLAMDDRLESLDGNGLITRTFRKKQYGSLFEHRFFFNVLRVCMKRLDAESSECELFPLILVPHEGVSLV
ncbi:hypothetical protein MRX96_047414 [Rhipicephalus microplus]